MDLILEFEQKVVGGRTRRLIVLHGVDLPKDYSSEGIYFDIDDARMPEPLALDGFMFAFLHVAMTKADRYIINGPVTRKALRNAQIFQEAWRCWLPDKCRIVDIVPACTTSEALFAGEENASSIAAFSGGVDATFLALRQSRDHPSFYNLKTVLTVHGFDVPIERDDTMYRLIERTEPLLSALGLDRRVITTNVRQAEWSDWRKSIQNWEYCFGPLVACALHQFSHEFNHGLLGSSEPYSHPISAWGSTPSTDYLLSGGGMEIIHEGAGYSRTEKIALINEHPIARRTVKVCWAGNQHDKNCGVCEKCVRTRLNFVAVGENTPPCFDGPLTDDMVDNLKVINDPQLTELVTILEYAERHSVNEPFMTRLRHRVNAIKTEGYSRKKSLATRLQRRINTMHHRLFG